MEDNEKTREQLVIELKELRLQNAAQGKSMTESISSDLVAQEAIRYAESIVETIRESLLVMDENLKIISANRSFYKIFKVTPDETIGNFIYNLGNKQWDIPKLRELLENILPVKEEFNDFEVDHIFEKIGQKTMLLNARQIYRQDINSKVILLAIEDTTLHKQLEDALKESEYLFRRTYETADDAILLLEKHEGKIDRVNPSTEKMLGYTEDESIGKMLQDIGVKLDMSDIKTTMQILDKNGIINYKHVPIKTKSGQRRAADIYLVNKSLLIQCNIRDVTESQQNFKMIEETNRVFVDRELKMRELKKQIAEMEKQKK